MKTPFWQRLFPRSFRERVGIPLQSVLEELSREPQYQGVWGRMRLWSWVLCDMMMAAIQQAHQPALQMTTPEGLTVETPVVHRRQVPAMLQSLLPHRALWSATGALGAVIAAVSALLLVRSAMYEAVLASQEDQFSPSVWTNPWVVAWVALIVFVITKEWRSVVRRQWWRTHGVALVLWVMMPSFFAVHHHVLVTHLIGRVSTDAESSFAVYPEARTATGYLDAHGHYWFQPDAGDENEGSTFLSGQHAPWCIDARARAAMFMAAHAQSSSQGGPLSSMLGESIFAAAFQRSCLSREDYLHLDVQWSQTLRAQKGVLTNYFEMLRWLPVHRQLWFATDFFMQRERGIIARSHMAHVSSQYVCLLATEEPYLGFEGEKKNEAAWVRRQKQKASLREQPEREFGKHLCATAPLTPLTSPAQINEAWVSAIEIMEGRYGAGLITEHARAAEFIATLPTYRLPVIHGANPIDASSTHP
jgi:hypothetical protein